jgi:hypothetical protein
VLPLRGRTDAVHNEDESGKRSMDRNIHICMKFIHNTREGRNRDLNAGINILGSLATELDGQIRSADVQLDIREWKRSSQTKNPQ